jgi:cytochrome c oxidase assembly protein subunit 15
VARWYGYLLLAAATMTYLLIVMGGVVCVTGGSKGCPDWPGCYGQPVPPMRLDSIVEYTHRVLSGLASILIIAAAALGLWRYRSIRWVSWPPALAIPFLIAVTIFGALVVLRGLSPGLAAVDLGSALVVLALMLAATVVAWALLADPALPDRLSFRDPFARWVLLALVSGFVVLVSGVLAAKDGSLVRCLGWPLYGEGLAPAGTHRWPGLARQLLATGTGILLLGVIVQAWRLRPGRKAIQWAATAVGILFLAELATGALISALGPGIWLLVVQVALAVAVWAMLVALAVLAGLPAAPSAVVPNRESQAGSSQDPGDR